MSIKIFTNSPSQTKKVGEILAKEILKTKTRNSILICLKGQLGSGKTTFLQGFARGLKIKKRILSPTFVLLKRFPLKNENFENFYHIDCYRIKKAKEILNLGLFQILKNKKNILAIEWANKIKKVIKQRALWLTFKIRGDKKREIEVQWKS